MTKKYLTITSEKSKDNKFIIICHAACNGDGQFQWFLKEDANSDSEILLSGHIYESMTISDTWIAENGNNMFLGCHCRLSDDDYTELVAFLTDDLITLLTNNVFTNILVFSSETQSGITYIAQENK